MSLLVAALGAAGARPCPAQEPEPVTLRSAVASAIARSPAVAAAAAARDEGAAGARLARDAFHPEASIIATPGYASGIPVFVAGQVPSAAGVDLRQTIYDPTARADALAAEAAEAARSGDFEAARTETARAVIALYARCRSDRAIADAAGRRVEAAQELVAHAEALRREGRRSDLDVERAALALARARQKALDALSDADLDLRELKLAIGISPGREIVLPDDPAAVLPAGAPEPEAALAADPALRALEREAEILDALRQSKARPIAPVVTAEAQYWRLAQRYSDFYLNFKADDWSVGVAVALPIFSGGRVSEDRVRSDHAWRRATEQARDRREALGLRLARAEAGAARADSDAALAR
ncbi:MAG TPA: TolC family protein, partial [Thermoanaerobaculia bacterium]|nr:TolC family protein [Thermoanaerobaculia bacterium]